MKKIEFGKIVGPEEAQSTLTIEFTFPEDIEKLKTVTDLTAKEVFFISYIFSILEKFGENNLKIIREYIYNFLRLRISMWREGRKETLLSLFGMREMSEEEKRRATQMVKGLR